MAQEAPQKKVDTQAASTVRGIALGLYPGTDAFDAADMVAEIADTGADTVALVVSWRQATITSDDIAPGDVTVNDSVLRAAITEARARDLTVVVFPILLIDRTEPGQWRGTIAPNDISAWWLSYEAYILHYAAIAAGAGADAVVVGSEMSSTETWRDRWYHLIGRTERVFDGTIIYSANWDHYQHVSFWRRVDVVGVTGYHPLSRDDDAKSAELVSSWQQALSQLSAFGKRQGKPIWLTEVGYTNIDGTATAPWDYTREGDRDLEEQRRCYAAFASAWRSSGGLAGAMFWNWSDPAYTPRGRPAETELRSWMAAARPAVSSSP